MLVANPAFAGKSVFDMALSDIDWVHYDTQKAELVGSTIIDKIGKG